MTDDTARENHQLATVLRKLAQQIEDGESQALLVVSIADGQTRAISQHVGPWNLSLLISETFGAMVGLNAGRAAERAQAAAAQKPRIATPNAADVAAANRSKGEV